jgi:hypothetical protein
MYPATGKPQFSQYSGHGKSECDPLLYNRNQDLILGGVAISSSCTNLVCSPVHTSVAHVDHRKRSTVHPGVPVPWTIFSPGERLRLCIRCNVDLRGQAELWQRLSLDSDWPDDSGILSSVNVAGSCVQYGIVAAETSSASSCTNGLSLSRPTQKTVAPGPALHRYVGSQTHSCSPSRIPSAAGLIRMYVCRDISILSGSAFAGPPCPRSYDVLPVMSCSSSKAAMQRLPWTLGDLNVPWFSSSCMYRVDRRLLWASPLAGGPRLAFGLVRKECVFFFRITS